MAVATVDEYLSALEKSKLLAAEQLAQAHSLAGESSDAAALARALARENLVSRWQAAKLLAMGDRAQLRLGKYKLIERLGKGGMGTVFLAQHVTMNRRVALKIVPRAIDKDRASLDRFFAEARAIAALDHPNIVQAYSVDNEMDRYFIVMEYVDGQDLQRMVELGGPMDFHRAADFIRQAAEGLAHAHARNLVHCDIKPSNLLVNHQGVIKILDLGLARLNQSDDPRGAGGDSAIFTVDYMAPEQGLGATNFDRRADIYSLGCTLYFLLTGHAPFPEGSLVQRIVKHQTQEPRDILSERPGTPAKLVEVCKRMMMKQPEDRYQSIQEVSAALAAHLGLGSGASPAMPRAVKPIEEPAVNGNGAGDDWLTALARRESSAPKLIGGKSSGAMAAVAQSGAMRAAGKSGKYGRKSLAGKGGSTGGLSAALAWFKTTQGKIVGTLAAAIVLVALPTALTRLLSHPSPQVRTTLSADDAAKDSGTDASEEVRKTTIPELMERAKKSAAKADLAQTKTSATKPPKVASKPETKPPEKQVAKPEIKTAPPEKPKVAEKSPEKPPEKSPEKPVEALKPLALDELSAAVDLPATTKDFESAVSLGKLDLTAKSDVGINLLGGETIAKGNPKFTVEKDAGAAPAWSVVMSEKNKDAVKIARLFPEGGECKIEWTPEAKEVKEKSSLVRFCGLQFASAGKKHFTALAAPKSVPPLMINMDVVNPRPQRLGRDFALCDPSLLRLQILPLDKSLPKHEMRVWEKSRGGRAGRGKPQESELGDTVGAKGHVLIVLTKEHAPRVALNIGFDMRGRDVALEMQGACEIADTKIALNTTALQAFSARVEAFLMVNENATKSGRKGASSQEVQLFKKAKDELKALSDLAGELDQKATIPFRVYVTAGPADDAAAPKVVIFESGQAEIPKTHGQKKKSARQRGRAAPDADDELK